LLTAQADTLVKSWDLSTPGSDPTEPPAEKSWVHCTAFSPDGRLLAGGYGRHRTDRTVVGHVRIRDVASGRIEQELDGHVNWVYSLAFSADGRRLATGGWDGSVMTWDVASGRSLSTLVGHEGIVMAVAFSPDGQTLASTGYDQTVRTWNLD